MKISSPLNPVAEVKQAIRDARKSDQLAEQAAMRVFEVFRALKFNTPTGPPVGDLAPRSCSRSARRCPLLSRRHHPRKAPPAGWIHYASKGLTLP